MDEIKIPPKEMQNKSEDEKYLVTSVTSEENSKEYFLYSDGNLYEKDNEGNLIRLDNISPESKKIAEKILQNFKPGKTDVIHPEKGKNVNSRKKEIDVDYPEL